MVDVSNVTLEVRADRERPLAEVALVRLLPGVGPQMPGEVGRPRKGLAAILAAVALGLAARGRVQLLLLSMLFGRDLGEHLLQGLLDGLHGLRRDVARGGEVGRESPQYGTVGLGHRVPTSRSDRRGRRGVAVLAVVVRVALVDPHHGGRGRHVLVLLVALGLNPGGGVGRQRVHGDDVDDVPVLVLFRPPHRDGLLLGVQPEVERLLAAVVVVHGQPRRGRGRSCGHRRGRKIRRGWRDAPGVLPSAAPGIGGTELHPKLVVFAQRHQEVAHLRQEVGRVHGEGSRGRVRVGEHGARERRRQGGTRSRGMG